MNFIKGLYGYFEFVIVKKKFNRTFKTPFSLYAEIIEVENGNILIKDNDDMEYIVAKKNIKTFTPCEKPEG